MWEKVREDGKKKIKSDAVPTLFSFTVIKQKRKLPIIRESFVKWPCLLTEATITDLASSSTSCELASEVLTTRVNTLASAPAIYPSVTESSVPSTYETTISRSASMQIYNKNVSNSRFTIL